MKITLKVANLSLLLKKEKEVPIKKERKSISREDKKSTSPKKKKAEEEKTKWWKCLKKCSRSTDNEIDWPSNIY